MRQPPPQYDAGGMLALVDVLRLHHGPVDSADTRVCVSGHGKEYIGGKPVKPLRYGFAIGGGSKRRD